MCQFVSVPERAAGASVSVLLLLKPFVPVLLQVVLLQPAAFMVLLYTGENWPSPSRSPFTLSMSPSVEPLRLS